MLKPKRKILRQEIEQDPFIEKMFSIKNHFELHKKNYLRSIAGFAGTLLIISLLLRSQSTNANNASITLNKAMVFMAQKDNLNAMIFLQEANDNYSNTDAGLDAAYYLGKIHFDREDYLVSENYLKDYANNGNNKLLLGASCQLLADIYKINKDLENAIKYQKLQLKYINSKVDKAYANINLAKLSYKMGDKQSAQRLIKQVINENSDNFDIIQFAEQANGEILVK